jgi:hypothetical protein
VNELPVCTGLAQAGGVVGRVGIEGVGGARQEGQEWVIDWLWRLKGVEGRATENTGILSLKAGS